MPDITIHIPDDKLDDLMASLGDASAATDEERVAIADAWLTEIVRNHMWNHQRSTAANAVTDPLA